MPDYNFMDDDDAVLFKQMAAWFRQMRGMPQQRGGMPETPQRLAPMLIVLTPSGGIPAALGDIVGSGTGTVEERIGTGTATGDEGDRPGFAVCEVYRLLQNTARGRLNTRKRAHPMGFSITVYNLSHTAVNGTQFITALLDANGDYVVPALGYLFSTCT